LIPWTVEQCEEKIEHYQDKLAEYEDAPSSTSHRGFSVDNSGKLEHFRKQLTTWRQRLKRARSAADGESSRQGPDLKLT